jgi:hypothetical protein
MSASTRSRSAWTLVALGLIAVFFLIGEHRLHVLGVLPYVLLLACPLLHMFSHRSHSGGDSHSAHRQSRGRDRS